MNNIKNVMHSYSQDNSKTFILQKEEENLQILLIDLFQYIYNEKQILIPTINISFLYKKEKNDYYDNEIIKRIL